MSDIGGAEKKRGRPTLLTPETAQRVVDALKAGNFLDTAAAYVGVNRKSLHEWLKKGRAKGARDPYRGFVVQVDEAMAQAEVMFAARIANAAGDPRHWTAAAWMLERRWPDRWAKRDRVEHTGKDGGPIKTEQVLHELDERMDELAKRRAEKQQEAV